MLRIWGARLEPRALATEAEADPRRLHHTDGGLRVSRAWLGSRSGVDLARVHSKKATKSSGRPSSDHLIIIIIMQNVSVYVCGEIY